MESENNKKVYCSAQEIMDAYDISRPMFHEYRKLGMPARLFKGAWHGHKENIDRWFRDFTAVSQPDVPENVG